VSAQWRLRAFSEVQPRQVRWLVPGHIPLRAFTLVGVGGLGKSTWLIARAGDLSLRGVDVIIVSFEDTAEEVIRPRLEAAGADLDRVHEMVLKDARDIDTMSLPRDLDQLRELVQSVTARLIVIDPVVAAIETKFDAHKDQHVRHILGHLVRLAEEEDAAVAGVGHLNKTPSTDAYIRVANSVAFWNASRSRLRPGRTGPRSSDRSSPGRWRRGELRLTRSGRSRRRRSAIVSAMLTRLT
jgi:AAA domain